MKFNSESVIILVKIIFTALFLMVFGYIGLIGLILLTFSGQQNLGIFSFIAYADILICVLLAICNLAFLKKSKMVLGGVFCAAIIAVVGIGLYNSYVENIPTIGERGYLGEYEPFRQDTLAKKLMEEPTLKLTENLPKLDCATALYPVAASFVQAVYSEQDYSFKDSILSCTTTTSAYERLINGEIDMIFVAGASDEQIEAAKAAGVELTFTPIGKEAFVFFVNSKNKVDNLTVEQIQGIYSGEIANWKELGGKNKEIRAFQRAKDSGSQTALIRLMGGKNLIAPIENDIVITMGEIIDRTADYKNYSDAIGFSFRFYSTEMVKNNQIKLLKLNGIEPNKDTIRNGEYPVVGDFYAVTADTKNPNVQPLIDWILSPQGQFLIEETGYVSIK